MKLKFLKYPKKPKKSASIAVKERWLARCGEIDKINAQRLKDHRHSIALSEKISGFVSSRVTHPTSHSTLVSERYRRKKPVARKKKTGGKKRYKTTRSRR